MASNRENLATIIALHAIEQARRKHLPPPAQRVMNALAAAIDDCRARLSDLALRGQVNSPEYLKIESQLVEWHAAWRSNR